MYINIAKCVKFHEKLSLSGSPGPWIPGLGSTVYTYQLPKDQNELMQVIPMVNYYDRFLPSQATKCAPLHDLLHKDKKWYWNCQHTSAIDQIAEALTSADSLAHYDPKLPLM